MSDLYWRDKKSGLLQSGTEGHVTPPKGAEMLTEEQFNQLVADSDAAAQAAREELISSERAESQRQHEALRVELEALGLSEQGSGLLSQILGGLK